MKLVFGLLILLISSTLPFSANAQVVDNTVIGACYNKMNDNQGGGNCFGIASNTCQNSRTADFDGNITYGITQCLNAEMQVWDALLNSNYQSLLKLLVQQEDGAFTNDPDRSDALQNAQRAWIKFRDTECMRLYAQWQDGTIRSNVHASCMLNMTARRAVALIGDMR